MELLSTGGTARLLQKEGVPAVEVSAYTGFPEMLDGRVKTRFERKGLAAGRVIHDFEAHLRQTRAR